MRFERLAIDGVMLVQPEPHTDTRGMFARTYCSEEFQAHGVSAGMVQANTSFNASSGTVRGMHLQWPPSSEGKLVRCVRGAISDVALDLRPSSPGFLQHVMVDLDEDNRFALYIPPGLAHGFQTRTNDTEVFYMMTAPYAPELSIGFRWDDPAFGIRWPLPVSAISAQDAGRGDFVAGEFEAELARRIAGQER